MALEHDGELQLALRRIAEWRKQREEAGDLEGLLSLGEALDAQRQAAVDAWLQAGRRQVREGGSDV
jgi:hypothetical protein